MSYALDPDVGRGGRGDRSEALEPGIVGLERAQELGFVEGSHRRVVGDCNAARRRHGEHDYRR